MIFTRFLSFETGPASPRTTAIGLAFTASVLLIVTTLVAKVTYEIDTTGERAQGEVIRFVETSDDMQRAVFRFTGANGQVHTVTDGTQSTHKLYELGEIVPIVYNPDDPGKARKDGAVSLYLAPVALGLMSMLFYAGAGIVWRFRSHLQKDYEARRGRTIVTTVNSDGSVTQTTHSSAPVFRWTGIFLAVMGLGAWLGALGVGMSGPEAQGTPLTIGFTIAFVVVGSLLLLGAAVSLRHAKFLRDRE